MLKQMLRPWKEKLMWQINCIKNNVADKFTPDYMSALSNILKIITIDTKYNNDKFNFECFFQYIQAINFARNTIIDVALEIGTGYSTFLLPRIKNKSNKLISLDGKSIDKFNYSRELCIIKKDVEFITDFSVTIDEMEEFYSGKPKHVFLDTDANHLKEAVKIFIKEDYDSIYFLELGIGESAKQGDIINQILDKLFRDNQINCFSTLFPSRFKSDIGFAGLGKKSALDKILERYDSLDYVFFDCGELSSMIEWMKLKDHIRVGGLAAFHDIYFPKSIKNFMVCAAIHCSPNWRIIYQDESTPQGLLVAEKVAN